MVSEIAAKGLPRAFAITGDVSDPATPARVVKEVEESLGPVDILLNNAGTSWVSTLEHEENLDRWWRVMEVNVRGPMEMNHAVLPSMTSRGAGTIITVSSVGATMTVPGLSSYCTSKLAILKVNEILDVELRQHGINIYTVHPGSIPGTTLGGNSFNETAVKESKGLQQFLEDLPSISKDTLALAADTLVALAADRDAQVLSGRYVDATADLGQVIAEAKKGAQGRIEQEGLYKCKVELV